MSEKKEKGSILELPGAPKIEGLHFRRFAGPGDFEHMADIFNESNASDGVYRASTAEDFAHSYKHKKNDSDPYQDIFFAEINGEIVAYGSVFWDDEFEGPRVYYHMGYVKQHWRGKGLGRAMMGHNQKYLRDIASQHPAELEKVFQVWAAEQEIECNRLFIHDGYKPIRYFYLMLRDLKEEIRKAEFPEGLETRAVEKDHFRKIFAASNEAFRDHFGHSEKNEIDYQRWISDPKTNKDLYKVAWDGDQVAGMVLNFVDKEENEKLDVNWAWTDPISVRLPWRKRGLARALLLESLKMLQEKGFAQAALGVDTQNPNGALSLYESTGYQTVEKWTDYRKAMD